MPLRLSLKELYTGTTKKLKITRRVPDEKDPSKTVPKEVRTLPQRVCIFQQVKYAAAQHLLCLNLRCHDDKQVLSWLLLLCAG